MSAEENKALARRWVEGLFNEGNLNVADEILSPDFVLHAPFDPRELRGPEAVKQFISAYRQAFPDGHTTIEDQIAEGMRRSTAGGSRPPTRESFRALLRPAIELRSRGSTSCASPRASLLRGG